MFETIKKVGKWVGRKLGLIKHLNELHNHKSISIGEEEYSRISRNKKIYGGYYPPWHDLKYKSSTGNELSRKMNSLGMGKQLAKKMARLIANEGLTISLAETTEGEPDPDKQKQWEMVSDTLTSNKFKRELQRYLEYMFALGGVVIEIYVDGEDVKFAYADASAIFPISTDSEQVDEVAIANVFYKEDKKYTLVKWHEWGEWITADGEEMNYRVKNELYETGKNSNDLGDKVSLSRIFPDMDAAAYFHLNYPLFVYMKPNEANNRELASPLGVSIFENCLDTLKNLDIMFDFWYNEFRLGKRRVAVPSSMLRVGTDIYGNSYQYLDDTEELFVALDDREMDRMQIKDLTTDLRVEEVIHSIQSLLDILSMQVGLSQGTFTFTNQGMKTATQVVSENSETYQTRASHIQVIEDSLRDLIMAVYETACIVHGVEHQALDRMDFTIDFNDGIFTDRHSELNFYVDAFRNNLIPQRVAIQKAFNLSEDEAKEWLEEMAKDNRQKQTELEQAIQEASLDVER